MTAQFTRPGQATQYTIGDLIANSQTAADVVPLNFTDAVRNVDGGRSARIVGARCVASCASGSLVTTAFDFDLLLFRPASNIPFAAGSYPADNGALALTADKMDQLIGAIRFYAGSWKSYGATDAAHQASGFLSPLYLPVNLEELGGVSVLGLVQAAAAWNPGNVAQTLRFQLYIDGD